MLLLTRVVLLLFATLSTSQFSQSQEQVDRQIDGNSNLARALVDSWGGGKEVNGSWTLNQHWVGILNVVVATGAYAPGKHLEPKEKSTPTRFNVLVENTRLGGQESSYIALIAMGKHGFSQSAMFREKLPLLDDLRDSTKHHKILTEFGKQHGWTDAWGEKDHMHWTEGWTWFTKHERDRLRVLDVFAHVSQRKKEPKSIDHLIIREGVFRLSDPSNAEDLRVFPLPATEEEERQRSIEEQDDKQPQPLRSFLKAKHIAGDSELKAYFEAIHAFREQPSQELLKQLVGNLDEDTREISGMLGGLFRSPFDEKIGKWDTSKHKEACRQLVNALPSAKTRDALFDALVVVLAETELETLEFNADGISISMQSNSRGSRQSYSYGRFEIQQTNMKKIGEMVRDELHRLLK